MAKVNKCSAGYGSNPAGFSCGVCMFYSEHTCAIVEGRINPEDCCNLFWSRTFKVKCKTH